MKKDYQNYLEFTRIVRATLSKVQLCDPRIRNFMFNIYQFGYKNIKDKMKEVDADYFNSNIE